LVLAHDPDADRLAVCVPRGTDEWRTLTGNQVGVLLADYVLRHQGPGPKSLLVSSIVSSPMIESVAKAHGAIGVRTLTGFKWMLNAALELERTNGWRFVFAYEEALGYCVRGCVRDKDGISAGLLFADLLKEAKSFGRTAEELLGDLYAAHGLWTSSLTTVAFPRIVEAEAKMQRFRAEPPRVCSGLPTLGVTDYTRNAEQRAWYLGESNLLELELEQNARVLVRPSGTEPKLKIYADFRQDYDASRTLHEQEAEATARVEALGKAVADLFT